MKKGTKENNISCFGEFTDRSLENEFFNYDMGRAIKYIRPITLVLGILYMLFIIPDYFLIKNPNTFRAILINRTVFLLLIVILFIAIKKLKNFTILAHWITVYEILGSISFLVIVYQYESPNYLIQAFGVMVIILAIYLAPNKWLNTLVTSIFASLLFTVLSACYIKGIKASEFTAGVVYIFIVIVLSSIASYRTNYYKRKQYTDSKELLRLSIIDPLTGIYNRAKFDEELQQCMDYSKRYETPLSLVIFDFDNFKIINDTYGHLVGDKVIVDTVTIIESAIRQTDLFARWGGEEFVMLLPNTDRQHAMELTERLRILISHHVFDSVGNITCSFGVVMYKENDDAYTLLHRADQLLYTAKSAGKNTVAC